MDNKMGKIEPYSAKQHLSPNQLNMYMRCSAQWMFRYVEGIKIRPGISLLFGNCFDEVSNTNFRQKMETFEDLPVDDLKDCFVTEWDGNKDRYQIEEDDKPEEKREQGILLVDHWRKTRAPAIQPAGVQEKLSFSRPEHPYDIIQYSDVITADSGIIDNKTTTKSPSKDKETGVYLPKSNDHIVQMSLYEIGYEQKFGERPEYLELDYAVIKKDPDNIQVQWTPRDYHRKYVLSLIDMVTHGIESKVFIPNRGNFLCSKRFCGYAAICEAEFGGKVKE